ncbi:TonB-dependent receptor [Psychromonas sp. 14N.309.X.WAT.B.A12]|uniref:TonB-dependent receptor n=1 Tax=Psychromonas sp. 14N.309.X.WAT.B.A12 TaxID=2998322 RepID=UPI0025B12914|nr:TonB-dependent receptor [Psychromonas sp. 14N.309.X.WAT.B.A12]MDN2662339.1 TonB-dependent receptor [Psychromonas sp. 14N.309.X.WAT.B.A12]
MKHCKVYAGIMLALSGQVMAEEPSHTEVMIVTGEKMDRDIKDTTTAVTVIHGEDIDKTGAKTVNDVVIKAPNVVTSGFGSVNIRGVNGSGAATGFYAIRSGARQRVDTNVDGVSDAFTGYNFSGSGVWDVQQVEVLRGPQSTTQGENSIGGAVTVKTNDPTFAPEYAIRGGAEIYENGNVMKNVALMASGPINDELAYRFAFDGTDGQSYITYDGDSIPVDPEDSQNLNFRGKLLWEPAFNEDLSIKLTTNYRKADGNYLNWANWDGGTGYEDETLTLGTNYNEYLGRDYSYNTRIQDSDVYNVSSEINYKINSQVSSKTLISYNSQRNIFDQYPTEQTYNFKDKTAKIESQLTFTPTDSKIDGFVGIMAADRENTVASESYSTQGKTDETRVGVFGEMNYYIDEQFTVTAGARVQREKQHREFSATYVTNEVDNDIQDTYLLPKLAFTYSPVEDTTFGISVRQGYNSGGLGYYNYGGASEVYTYESESVTAYELSAKTAFNNSTTINTAVFYNDYRDYQGISDYKITNVDESHTMGLEVELAHWLTDSLEVRPAIGLLKTKVDNDDSFGGNELSNAPDFNASLALTQYVGENLTLGADVTYVSEYYSDLDNTDDYKAGEYAIVGANVDYTIGDLLISGYITNLTDEDVVYLINGGYRASVGQSRTVGLNLTYRM